MNNRIGQRGGIHIMVFVISMATVLFITAIFAPFYSQSKSVRGDLSRISGGSENLDEKVEALLRNMTLEEKVGQLMIVGFDGFSVNEHAQSMISKYKVGGFILFDRNMDNPQQVTELINRLQAIAAQQKNEIPLFMCIDQEGGIVARMEDRMTVAPSQQELARKGDENDIGTFAELTGTELAAMGFNVNFAPVLDLSDTDSRSYGKDPYLAGRLAQIAVTAYARTGVIPSLKHFPGIGRTRTNLHFVQDAISVERTVLESTDMEPFKQIMQSVDSRQYFVMVSHLIYTHYDPDHPASISGPVIRDLLRGQLGYQGVVITDDMEMGALAKTYNFSDMGYLALAAGADMLLVCHDREHEEKVYNGILQAVAKGKLSRERIDESVRRVLKMKLSRLNGEKRDPSAAADLVGNAQNREILAQFRRRANIK